MACSPGRPVGAVNKITRSLREQVLDGFEKKGGVTTFVQNLAERFPPAAAGLLSKILPPMDDAPAGSAGVVTAINILSIPHCAYLVGNPLRVATEEEARQLSKVDTLLMIEHRPEEMIAAPVESVVEVEIAQADEGEPVVEEPPTEPEPNDDGVLVIRSQALIRARRAARGLMR